MRILSCDWATKKALKIYDSQTKKVKTIQNSIDEFEKFLKTLGGSAEREVNNSVFELPSSKVTFLFEHGGGDTFKIMAFRTGHQVLQVPGKKINDYRESLGKEKTDEGDAKLIYDYYKEASTDYEVNKNSEHPLSRLKDNKAGSAKEKMRNSKAILPSFFSLFTEQNADIAEIKILFREHEDLKKDMVREKLKKIAFKRKFEIAQVADDRIKKMLFHKDAAIVAKEKEVEQIKKILEKKVKQFRIWDNYLEGVKGIGPVIAAGLIGELGGRQFDSDESLKHYAGMLPRNDSHNYNRYVKVVLFQFAEGIIKQRTPVWRDLYDSMKEFYRNKHADWRPGKIDAYAKKFVETKFLLEFWKEWNKFEE